MAVLHPVVKRLAGLLGLWVFYSIMFFPGTAFSLTIYLVHSLLISCLDIHLVFHSFTLLICNVVGSQSIFKKELLSISSLVFSQSVCLSTIMNLFYLSCKRITLPESLLNNTYFLQYFNAFFSSCNKFDGIPLLLVS